MAVKRFLGIGNPQFSHFPTPNQLQVLTTTKIKQKEIFISILTLFFYKKRSLRPFRGQIYLRTYDQPRAHINFPFRGCDGVTMLHCNIGGGWSAGY